jgi:hypothetical protein
MKPSGRSRRGRGDLAERHRDPGRAADQGWRSGDRGIGVSGSPGVDGECINAALDKVKDLLQ